MTFKEKLSILRRYHKEKNSIPNYKIIGDMFGGISKTAVMKFVNRAEKEGYLTKGDFLQPTKAFTDPC